MTPEGKVKEAVKKVLKKHNAYYHMPVQNGMGSPTLDFIGCHCGIYFAVEAKAPGKHPTPRQLNTISQIENSGGKTFIIDSVKPKELEDWLIETARRNGFRGI